MQVKKILNKDDLIEIAEFFISKGYGENISVDIEISDKTLFKKINEDYFYKLNPNADESVIDDVEELNINICGFKFKYFIREK